MAAQQEINAETFDDVIEAPTKVKAKKPTSPVERTSKAPQERFIAEPSSAKALDATQLYLNEIGFSPLLTPEEEVHFARLARKGDEKGRKRMIESNLRLVV